MTPNPIWQQSRLMFTLEVVAIAVVLVVLVYITIALRKYFNRFGGSFQKLLMSASMAKVFTVARYGLALAGVASLVVTIFPGLMPFRNHVDPNLGLGGIALFFLWPFIAAQIAAGALPSEKYLMREPVLVWVLLLICYIIGLNIDKAAIGLVYG